MDIVVSQVGLIAPGISSFADLRAKMRSSSPCLSSMPHQPFLNAKGEWAPDRIRSVEAGVVHDLSTDSLPPYQNHGRVATSVAELDPLFLLAGQVALQLKPALQGLAFDAKRAGVILGQIVLPTDISSQWLDAQLSGTEAAGAVPSSKQAAKVSTLAEQILWPDAPAKYIAQILGFSGPAYSLDAACASSLYALALGCQALRIGDLDLVVVGGLSRPQTLFTQMGFSALRAYAPQGTCLPLSNKSQGLVVGDGAGLFLLHRAADARFVSLPGLARVCGVGLSNDQKGGILAPDSQGQLAAIHSASAQAGFGLSKVDYVECHATGTPMGDRVEWESLQTAFALDSDGRATQAVPLRLGSAKGQFGHLLTAAGALGLARILAGFKEQVYPLTHTDASSLMVNEGPAEPAQPCFVMTSTETWQANFGLRRAAINGFGFGGINAHVLVEEIAPNSLDPAPRPDPLFGVGSQRPQGPTVSTVADSLAVIGLVYQAGSQGDSTQTEAFKTSFPSPPAMGNSHNSEKESSHPIDAWHLEMSGLGIPPAALHKMLPAQIMALALGQRLKRQYQHWSKTQSKRVGMILGLGHDLRASRFFHRWHLRSQDQLHDLKGERFRTSILDADQTLGHLGSVVASRVAQLLALGGPCYTVSDGLLSSRRALRVAQSHLRSQNAEVMIAGAFDFVANEERLKLAELPQSAGGDAGVMLVLKPLDAAKQDQDPIWAELSWHQSASTLGPIAQDADWETFGGASFLLALARQLMEQPIGTRCQWGDCEDFPMQIRIPEGAQALRKAWQPMPETSASEPNRTSSPVLQIKQPYLTPASFDRQVRETLEGTKDVLARDVAKPIPGDLPMNKPAIRQQSSKNLDPQQDGPLGPVPTKLAAFAEFFAANQRVQGRAYELFRQIQQQMRATNEMLLPLLHAEDKFNAIASANSPLAGQDPQGDEVAWIPYSGCLELAIGSLSKVLGEEFRSIDKLPSRVRLPDEPLLLCHRIMKFEGDYHQLGPGRLLTEHDIRPDSWYLDGERIPVSICVEAGQADLVLAGFLGIDEKTKGERFYRLLNADVTFFADLPGPGKTIQYDIRIKEFFRQGETILFRFEFDGSVGGRPLLKMRSGVAGFFHPSELEAGKGLVQTALDLAPARGHMDDQCLPLSPWSEDLTLDERQVDALRQGDFVRAFGQEFSGLACKDAIRLPGGLMRLVHRVKHLQMRGGRFALGFIEGEADIAADDWFLTSHFMDDPVMPGTLMYECCLHTLKILLLRRGWVGETAELLGGPVPNVCSSLKCRGQVLQTSKKVQYRVEIKELRATPVPLVLADAVMCVDGKPIVEIRNMSLSFPKLNLANLQQRWSQRKAAGLSQSLDSLRTFDSGPLYNNDRILDFAIGRPSDAFGAPYKIFDHERKIARLPGPPYKFLDRIVEVQGAPFELAAQTSCIAEYDFHPSDWYFSSSGSKEMPFAILLEVALQPCGWLAAYMGSALTSERDLRFRNLGGKAQRSRWTGIGPGTLRTAVTFTGFSKSADMLIQNFKFDVSLGGESLYAGETMFGFFSESALAQQVGLRVSENYHGDVLVNRQDSSGGVPYACVPLPRGPAWPHTRWRLIDEVRVVPQGGIFGLGMGIAQKAVRADDWYFKAHFYQDPVVPGSLGLETLLQSLMVLAADRWHWGPRQGARALSALQAHEWKYRGQITPSGDLVQAYCHIKRIDDREQRMWADGYLEIDGRLIYAFYDFCIEGTARV